MTYSMAAGPQHKAHGSLIARRSWRFGKRRQIVALATLISAIVLGAAPAPAQTAGGSGGGGGAFDTGGTGGGGPGVGGAPGSNGTDGSQGFVDVGGGGAGGGGAGGASGGTGGNSGGVLGGGPGADGGNSNAMNAGAGGGGGGNGGAHGQTVAGPINNGVPIIGGVASAGGDGGQAFGMGSGGGGGGGGGAGGYGLVVTGGTVITNGSSITGGIGGAGGAGGDATAGRSLGGYGGNGGDGGLGVYFTVPGATLTNTGVVQGGLGGAGGVAGNSNNPNAPFDVLDGSGGNGGTGVFGSGLTITNSGTIQGGNGGAGANGPLLDGRPALNGTGGKGGDGIAGSNLTIINSGTIIAGLGGAAGSGDAGKDGNAITFTGGTNILELWAGSTITGNVVAFSVADTLRLGGATSSSFDVSKIGPAAQYQGFGVFELKAAADSVVWMLTSTTTAVTPWTLTKGKLSVSDDGALGDASGALTFNGGTLQVTGTNFTSTARPIVWGASGGGFEIADAANTFTVAQSLIGGGPLSLWGPGTLVLSGTNTYAGGTTINSGTLQLGSGAETGSIQGDVANSGTLIFNRSNTYDFAGTISGSGTVVQNGNGTTVFNTAQPYTGPTTINHGVLSVNSTLASSLVTVNAGGTLGGTGTIFNGVDNFGNVAPGNSIGDLTIMGAYVGFGGTLTIESVLAGNGSPIDHLILSGATASASGTTGIVVVNLPGSTGAQTTGNGIPVVIATGGATSTATAFNLAGPVAAGPFQYLLFRGPQAAGTADDQNSWYLRSHTTANTGGGGGGGGGPGPEIPLYRPETASYALFPALARSLAVSSIGSFHERNGDQALAAGSKRERMWGRIFGEHSERSHGGHVTPSFEGHAAGFQAGADVYETIWNNGVRGRAGLFVGWAEARGDIKGFVLGNLQGSAGDAQLEATSVGGYGTLIGPGGWYLDGIVMPSFYSGDGKSTNGIGVNADGWSLLGSLEAGMPLRIGGGFTLEPQAQLIYQHLDFDDAADPFSTVSFRTPDAVSGRIGVRLAAELAQGRVRPYLKANLWQDWLDKDGVIYAGTHRLDTEHGGTALEVGGGLVAELMPGVGLWGVVDYTTDIAGDTERETLRGNAGVRITW